MKIIQYGLLSLCVGILTGCTFMYDYNMELKNTGNSDLTRVKVSSGELYQTFGILVPRASSGGYTPIPMTKGRKIDIYWEIENQSVEETITLPRTADKKNDEYVQISIDGEKITDVKYIRLPDW